MPDKRMLDVTAEVMASQERRRQRRVMISTSVRIKSAVGGHREFDESTTTINLSPAGFLIETGNPDYHRNMKVVVTLPYRKADHGPQTEQEGSVVRVTELSRGRRSVAIALKACGESSDSSGDAGEGRASEQAAQPVVVILAEESASQSMKAYLSGEGYHVIALSNTDEARNVLDECNPALVIAEIEGEDSQPGYELCTHCKQTPRLKGVPVMLITNSAYPSDYAKAHSVGAVVCMAKPYRRERLGHVVRLLAPPPNADHKAIPPRKADTSRRAGAHRSKAPSAVTVR
jgi:CheY-like chemotaxis protein